MSKDNILAIMAGILCLCLTGCGSISDYKPFGGGYIWVTHTHNSISEPSASQFALYYSPGKDKWWIKVWPDISGGIVVTNGIAVFIGEKASETPNPDNRKATTERLFAVRAPNLPLDITDQVLQQYCTETGLAFTNFVKDSFASLNETDNALEIPFGILSRGEKRIGDDQYTRHYYDNIMARYRSYYAGCQSDRNDTERPGLAHKLYSERF